MKFKLLFVIFLAAAIVNCPAKKTGRASDITPGISVIPQKSPARLSGGIGLDIMSKKKESQRIWRP
ncbi:hypothetical protein CKA38_09515 [Ereboglobus luteus]|uniref:Uncharacterized protein n=1 Tax=Ereboglobus luteus TaxID=1796921 RepID=A0A2U8E3N4_9BACT|nr:hypothetical protein CKA38_09515 [Ereboglobus luteus]